MTPILYSYRRCPYAMRARMALKYARINIEHREIELRNKPKSFLRISPKATVPVLCINELILDQSLDIMRWAIVQFDPDGWGNVDEAIAQAWIQKNDGPFKVLLDQYKYPNRFPELNQELILADAVQMMLMPMEQALQNHRHLAGDSMSWIDVAIFPFIRQFSMVDLNTFHQLPVPAVQAWLSRNLESDLFNSVMQKYPVWLD